MSFVIICAIVWHPVCTLLRNPVRPGQFHALPSECLALWQRHQLNMSVCHASSVVDMLGAQLTTCQHMSCPCWNPCTTSACFHGITRTPYTVTNWQWIFTGATHIILQSMSWSSRPSIFNTTYLWYPLIAVQWHDLHVLVTCLNLQSHHMISCQTCCYLIFWNFLVYLSQVENSKYGTRNTYTTGSTTGMNKHMPLILNNKHAVGVNDEVWEIIWFYKQR